MFLLPKIAKRKNPVINVPNILPIVDIAYSLPTVCPEYLISESCNLATYGDTIPRSIFLLLFVLYIFISQYGLLQKDSIDIDTNYSRVLIYNDLDFYSHKPIKIMQIGPLIHSAMFLNSNDLVLRYSEFFLLSKYFNPEIKNALMIGGGAYSFPKAFLREFPKATLDVAEIDPELATLAERHFRLQKNLRLNILNEDGRVVLNNSIKKYDAIFTDAFEGSTIPYQLTTQEAITKINDTLSPNGVYFLNIPGSIEGHSGRFFRAEYKTIQNIFPYVQIFPVYYVDGFHKQNIVIIASKKNLFTNMLPERIRQENIAYVWKKNVPTDMPILTDDFAPVDQYLSSIYFGER